MCCTVLPATTLRSVDFFCFHAERGTFQIFRWRRVGRLTWHASSRSTLVSQRGIRNVVDWKLITWDYAIIRGLFSTTNYSGIYFFNWCSHVFPVSTHRNEKVDLEGLLLFLKSKLVLLISKVFFIKIIFFMIIPFSLFNIAANCQQQLTFLTRLNSHRKAPSQYLL